MTVGSDDLRTLESWASGEQVRKDANTMLSDLYDFLAETGIPPELQAAANQLIAYLEERLAQPFNPEEPAPDGAAIPKYPPPTVMRAAVNAVLKFFRPLPEDRLARSLDGIRPFAQQLMDSRLPVAKKRSGMAELLRFAQSQAQEG